MGSHMDETVSGRRRGGRGLRAATPSEDTNEASASATEEATKKGGAYSIAVLNRAVEIMGVFSSGQPSRGLKDISKATGLPKSTVFRILSTLVEHEFCEMDPNTGEYSLGFALVRLADIRRRQANLHALAAPVMRDIRNALNETIVLSVRSGDTRVHIDSLEGLHPMRRSADLGVHSPLYAGASSKVLLAGLDDAEIEDYLARVELQQIQENTITRREDLLKEIALIRELGYAESRGELIAGGGAIAVPIKNYEGRTVAAIDVLTPAYRYTPEHRERCIGLMLHGARQISERLGYKPPA
ncbi:IclR family transcriptional regulator [Shinella sp. BE166]|uniref:IclR family transcriptional regulator n=1 Tax=Shinella sp. BE166 TaxID=3373918 RepID=UPI003EBEA59D